MSVQNCIGDSFRGATWVSLHNGGGTGWSERVEVLFCLFLFCFVFPGPPCMLLGGRR